MSYIYQKAILGGTFDHFHVGHEELLMAAFTQSEHVTIGLTQPVMYQQKFLASTIESYEIRETELKAYLREKNFDMRCTIIPIIDIYGTTLTDKDIETIFVTEENLSTIDLINTKRKEKDFPELKSIVVPYKKSPDGEIITSERIRKGEIDRSGFVYKSVFAKKTLLLPEDLRAELQRPLGKVAPNTESVLKLLQNKPLVIAVGDIIATSLIGQQFITAIDIIDFKTRRHEIKKTAQPHAIKTYNKQGTINRDAVNILQKALTTYLKTNKKQTIVISGEEDLLALPAILLAPLGTLVLYGQYDVGIVVNEVTEATKQKVLSLVTHFH